MKKNHKNKFKTPEGYFDNFNERLFERLAIEETSQESTLIPKSDGFAAPEGYFDSIYSSTIEKMKGKSPKVISLVGYKAVYYAAATVALIFVLALAWNRNQGPDLNFEDLASMDIETYFEDTAYGLSSYEIAEAVNLDDISIADITEKILEEESILEYLDANVEDLEDLDLDYDELQY
ncbi:hypothetical protein L0P88_00465 [Muricauda sp. SCSIO 64092]|uniref:hypothetical protein n=1 Tax=Allomuricauda sp. SCSIO 64092 TaxID=2908842 RepID=UPI001FF605EF|nr:hypothetical protein [Muricauda sp. SCSIO 64092]UOY07039.1 hypothetical protein L0P88_00465 [Muricauda sp. SCSIO 64092]